jgi:hypothetical protein
MLNNRLALAYNHYTPCWGLDSWRGVSNYPNTKIEQLVIASVAKQSNRARARLFQSSENN